MLYGRCFFFASPSSFFFLFFFPFFPFFPFFSSSLFSDWRASWRVGGGGGGVWVWGWGVKVTLDVL